MGAEGGARKGRVVELLVRPSRRKRRTALFGVGNQTREIASLRVRADGGGGDGAVGGTRKRERERRR